MPYRHTTIQRIKPKRMPLDSFKRLILISSVILVLLALNLLSKGVFNVFLMLINFLITIPIVLFSLTFHEYSHAAMANFLGDPTPRLMGRLTMNPFKHLDLLGTLMIFTTRFGWAKPVVVDPNHFRIPKRAMLSVAIAGPLANLFLAFIATSLMFATTYVLYPATPKMLLAIIYFALEHMIFINLGLAFFNLLPIPPLDGSRIVAYFVPQKHYLSYRKLSNIAPFLLLFLFFFGIISGILSPIVQASHAKLLSLFNNPHVVISLFLNNPSGTML